MSLSWVDGSCERRDTFTRALVCIPIVSLAACTQIVWATTTQIGCGNPRLQLAIGDRVYIHFFNHPRLGMSSTGSRIGLTTSTVHPSTS